MQQDVNPELPVPTAAAPPAADVPVVPSGPDPDYVAKLEAYVRQQQQELNRYEPFRDDLDWMAADESRREGVKRYRQAYEQAAKPEIHPDLKPVLDRFDAEIAPIKAYITRQEQTEQRAAQQQRQKFEADNMAFANRLAATEKLSGDQLQQIAAYADSKAQRAGRNVGIEEAYKDMRSFGPRTPEAAAPSLRADAGTPGVPGPSTSDGVRWKTDFHGALVDSIKAAQKAG